MACRLTVREQRHDAPLTVHCNNYDQYKWYMNNKELLHLGYLVWTTAETSLSILKHGKSITD